jgi:hypothetical protein
MSIIFGKKENFDEQQMANLGASVPHNLKMFFTLYGIYLGKSKSFIVRDCLEERRQKVEHEEHITENYMMEAIADEAAREWKNKDKIDGTFYPTYQHFLDTVLEALKKRKLSQEYIDRIMQKINRKLGE